MALGTDGHTGNFLDLARRQNEVQRFTFKTHNHIGKLNAGFTTDNDYPIKHYDHTWFNSDHIHLFGFDRVAVNRYDYQMTVFLHTNLDRTLWHSAGVYRSESVSTIVFHHDRLYDIHNIMYSFYKKKSNWKYYFVFHDLLN